MSAEGLRPVGLDQRSFDLGFPAESLACIIGPNETGKSRWLRALAGIEEPAEGAIRLLGQDVWRMDGPAWRRMRTRAAFLGASTPLLSVADGLTNVMLPAAYHGIAEDEVLERRARELLERLGWEGDLHRLPAYLDPHSRLLLALARCLLLGPELLFLDEPFGLMDQRSLQAMQGLVESLVRDDGITLVTVTHNLDFVQSAADVILFADGAGLSVYTDWEELARQHPEFVADASTADRGGSHVPTA